MSRENSRKFLFNDRLKAARHRYQLNRLLKDLGDEVDEEHRARLRFAVNRVLDLLCREVPEDDL